MIPGAIDGATHVLGAPSDIPEDLKPDDPRKVLGLPVREHTNEIGTFLCSAWYPEGVEIEAIRAGAPIILYVRGPGHPVVMLGVAPPPENLHEEPKNPIDVVELAVKVGATPYSVGVTFNLDQLTLYAQSIQVMCYEQWNAELAKSEIDKARRKK